MATKERGKMRTNMDSNSGVSFSIEINWPRIKETRTGTNNVNVYKQTANIHIFLVEKSNLFKPQKLFPKPNVYFRL